MRALVKRNEGRRREEVTPIRTFVFYMAQTVPHGQLACDPICEWFTCKFVFCYMRSTHLINWPGQIWVVFCVCFRRLRITFEPGSRPTGRRRLCVFSRISAEVHVIRVKWISINERWNIRAPKTQTSILVVKKAKLVACSGVDGRTFNFWLIISSFS